MTQIDLVDAIQSVSEIVRKISEPAALTFQRRKQAIRKSIDTVSSAVVDYAPAQTSENNSNVLKSIRAVSLPISDYLEALVPTKAIHSDPSPSILKAVRRQYDENLHSDFMAALLRPSVSPTVARRFFEALWSRATGTEAQSQTTCGFQTAGREVRLDQLNQRLEGTEKGWRRIDILVETADRTLIIENKVYSSESENQTKDYYSAVKTCRPSHMVRGLLLSPFGTIPDSNDFSPLTYFELYTILTEILESAQTPGEDDAQLLKFYLQELGETIVKPMIKALETSRPFLKGA
jgi:hypothetical protein